MTEILTEEEILQLPISKIVDGWTVKHDGKEFVYLFVHTKPGLTQTILIEKYRPQ
jgi:hypothetical protein